MHEYTADLDSALVDLRMSFPCETSEVCRWSLLLRVNSYFLLSNQSQCPVTKLSWNSLPFAIRNLGIKSTFQSLPLPMDAGGAPGILNLLYN